MQITEQQIAALAPNANAASNGKKISQKGGFIKRFRSEDNTFYMGECEGSGRSNYITSADYIHPEQPVFRCSCPSRQFPCKHSLALLYEIVAEKEFEICEIPPDIFDKRAKKESKKVASDGTGDKEKKSPPKINKTARTKKIKKQIEGLHMTDQLIEGLLKAGLGTMGGTSLKDYRDLAKQLGDYYLPGPQVYLNRLVIEMDAYQKDADNQHNKEAIEILVKLHALVKKAERYLKEKLESQELEDDDSILYEELGGIWQTERLNQLGLKKENARLLQLSFDVFYDEARKEYIDRGYWADVDTGEVSVRLNHRPIKALKYVKQEDTIFDMLKIPVLTYYPGESNKRVRWDGAEFEPVTKEVLKQLRSKAHDDILAVSKAVKNEIKNTLSDSFVALMLKFSKIGKTETGFVVEDERKNRLLLRDRRGTEETIEGLSMLPDEQAFVGQVLFGAVYYEASLKRICMQPYSILTEDKIIRLLY